MSYKTVDAVFIYCYALEAYIRVGHDGSVKFV
jgi:hypothetical protein